MEQEKKFRIRVYTKKELACLYSPNLTSRCAIRTLTKWIKYNQELCQQLTDIGYTPRTRIFMPRQVSIIVSFLDTPY